MLDKEFKFYIDNQEELVEKYKGKVLIIQGESVVATYDDETVAYLESKDRFGLGNFLLQRCEAGIENYTITFHGPNF